MRRWEYLTVNIGPGQYDMLQQRGAEGWEAWHTENSANGWREICFRRPARADGRSTTEKDKC